MFTDDMICAVAKYEASLGEDSEPITAPCARLVEELNPTTTTTEEP